MNTFHIIDKKNVRKQPEKYYFELFFTFYLSRSAKVITIISFAQIGTVTVDECAYAENFDLIIISRVDLIKYTSAKFGG